MAGLSAWMLLDYHRGSLTFQGSRVVSQGVVRRVEIDLADAVEARWRIHPVGGSLVVRDPATRLVVNFAELGRDQRHAIVARLREAIRPEIQSDWDLFAYKTRFGEGGKPRAVPGPGEILATRARWTRIFAPALVASAAVAAVAWWWTRHPSVFAVVPVVAGMWSLFRAMTPAEGKVEREISWRSDPDLMGPLAFFPAWGVVGAVGIFAFNRLWPRPAHPKALAIVGCVAWFGILLLTAHRLDRRQARRDREAAERAAREREEADRCSLPSATEL
ncbi:hypothetical protein VT85_23335 [Planctomyces sp. SH-PL62]|nr:hypothetical protein VT85_23335 [Planctomyces sp. SH-PL62]